MDFSNIFKILFEEADDDGQLRNMCKVLAEKENSISELKRNKEILQMGHAFVTMEHYTLADIFKQVTHHRNYQQVLESKIDQLLEATLKLGHILNRVEWHKIVDYDELVNAKKKCENDRLQREMQDLFERMENRPIVQEFRREQQINIQLEAMLEEAKKAVSREIMQRQSMLDAAIQRRNNVIIELVTGAKKIEELRLKLRLKKSTMVQKNQGLQIEATQQVNKPFLKVTSSVVQKPAESFVVNPPIENNLEQKLSTENIFKPPKSSANIRFNTLNFENFDFEQFEVRQKVIDNLAIEEPSAPLQSMLCNPLNESDETVPDQSKNEKHVQILAPPHSEGNREEKSSSSDHQISMNGVQESNIEMEVELTLFDGFDFTASEQMEIDIFDEVQEKSGEGKSNKTSESSEDSDDMKKSSKKGILKLDSAETKEKSRKSREKTFLFEELSFEENQKKISKEKQNQPIEQNLLESVKPLQKELFSEASSDENTPQKRDDSKNLNLFEESDSSDNVLNSEKSSDDFF